MKNRWNYTNLGQVKYGIDESYQRACAWLDEVGGIVEDWGCGCAFAKRFLPGCVYKGIDGSQNEYADLCGVDLAEYTSQVNCILMRHVLDHNEMWEKILDNALNSFRRRMSLVFFIEFGPRTEVVSRSQDPKYYGVPDIRFNKQDILSRIQKYLVREERIPISDILVDTIFYLEK